MNETSITEHIALLILQEIVSEVDDCDVDLVELRKALARSAMSITHKQRQRADCIANDLLGQYREYFFLEQECGCEDHDWYNYEPIEYDERVAEIWRTGVRQRASVRIKYQSQKTETTNRVVDPWLTSSPYSVGFCHLRNAARKFRFDRIMEIELTDKTFEKPDNWKTMI